MSSYSDESDERTSSPSRWVEEAARKRELLQRLPERALALVAGRVVGEVDRRDALVARDHVGDERDRGRGRVRVAVAPQRAERSNKEYRKKQDDFC